MCVVVCVCVEKEERGSLPDCPTHWVQGVSNQGLVVIFFVGTLISLEQTFNTSPESQLSVGDVRERAGITCHLEIPLRRSYL